MNTKNKIADLLIRVAGIAYETETSNDVYSR